jgi:hypothetical protein
LERLRKLVLGQNFASPGEAELNQRRTYALPDQLDLNEWALAGDGPWDSGQLF